MTTHPTCHSLDLTHIYTDIHNDTSHASSRCEKAKPGGVRVRVEDGPVGWLCSTCIDVSADKAHTTLHPGPDGKFVEGKGAVLSVAEKRERETRLYGRPVTQLPLERKPRPPAQPTLDLPNWRQR